jgi:hypothetical protein
MCSSFMSNQPVEALPKRGIIPLDFVSILDKVATDK